MADHDQDQPDKPQPLESLSEWIMKEVQDAAEQAAAVKRTGMDVADDRSGQLPPAHSPTHRGADDGPPSGWVRAKSLPEDLPPSMTEGILGNPQAFWPQPEPGPVQDLGPFGVAPQASIDYSRMADTPPESLTESILGDPGCYYQPEPGPEPQPGPEHDKGLDR